MLNPPGGTKHDMDQTVFRLVAHTGSASRLVAARDLARQAARKALDLCRSGRHRAGEVQTRGCLAPPARGRGPGAVRVEEGK